MDDLVKFFANPSLLSRDEAQARRPKAARLAVATNGGVDGSDDGDDDALMHKLAESIIKDDDDDEEARHTAVLGTQSSRSLARDIHDILAEDGELKADAPLFVPNTSVGNPPEIQ